MSKITMKINLPGGVKFECAGEEKDVAAERNEFQFLLDTIGYTSKNESKNDSEFQDTLPVAGMLEEDMPDGPCKISLTRTSYTTLSTILSGIKDGSIKMRMGDSFTCTLLDGQEVTFVVTDEDEDSLRFEMKELLKCMPHTDIEGWYEELFDMFPEELKKAIIPTKRKYREKGIGELKEFSTLLFLPSASEVFPAENWLSWMGDKGVYEQMEYYKDAANRVRCTVEDGLTYSWWLLSADSGNSTYFAFVRRAGYASSNSASNTRIAVPVCFRISKF